MSRLSPTPGSPKEWLARARSDLALARIDPPSGALYEDLCYHAQQAAEKALKAIYQHEEWPFPYTHDLDQLISGLKIRGIEPPDAVERAIVLSPYAWEARYPGLGEPLTAEDRDEAVRWARAVLEWANARLCS